MPTDFWSLASEPAQSKAGPAQENPFLKLEIIGRVFYGGVEVRIFLLLLCLYAKKKNNTTKISTY